MTVAGECPTCGWFPPPPFVEVPLGADLENHYYAQTLVRGTRNAEEFFSALMEGRVSLVPAARMGGFRVSVAPSVHNHS